MKYRAPRHPTRSSVVLTARGIGRYFIVTNVSCSGAGIVGDKELNVGQGVTLNYSGGKVNATVKWTDKRNSGIAFDHELDTENLNSIIATSQRIDQQPDRQIDH